MQGPKGTYDVLPAQQQLRDKVLHRAAAIFNNAGYGKINTPAFEDTGLFERGVGASSDIVRKEMYTFEDKGGRSLTLKPEGTAPVVRAFIQHGMHKLPQPVKLWYFERMYRFENPQAGRYREHYQLGAEAIGSADPALDVEMIMMLSEIYESLGVPEVELRLGSMGCPECRPVYQQALKDFLDQRQDELCGDCHERAVINPLRVFDCKRDDCQEQLAHAPLLVDNLCTSCSEHFETVKEYLQRLGRQFRVDGTLVRGFDYYTGTTFEYECTRLGAQKGIGGGGRYDRLVEELGGPATAAIGFGSGMERIVLALESAGVEVGEQRIDVFFMVLDPGARREIVVAMQELRRDGFSVDMDYAGRKPKGQMKQADRLGARLTVIVGEEELAAGTASVKEMDTGAQETIAFEELVATIKEKVGA
jgi:histidyl-tRNA synthetase